MQPVSLYSCANELTVEETEGPKAGKSISLVYQHVPHVYKTEIICQC
jgi:hypothetical protein